jgi:hypothetical protein
VEIDIDNIDESDGSRLIRRKTTRYLSHEQRAHMRFMYEKYQDGRGVETFLDDFESHVFFPANCASFLCTRVTKSRKRSAIVWGDRSRRVLQ